MKTIHHTIDCTGDACVGDQISFTRSVFSGRWPKSLFSHNEHVTGIIIRDSYGQGKQDQTFTIQTDKGDLIVIMAKNIYRNGTYRMPWPVEADRLMFLKEKHQRGDQARREQKIRRAAWRANWLMK